MPPKLSLIIAYQETEPPIEQCLDSLLSQQNVDDLEIILADGSVVGTNLNQERYSGVQLIRLTAGASLPLLLGTAIVQATGEIITITESHCTFPINWATSVIAAHHSHAEVVIGGAVEPCSDLSRAALGLYFADYGQFMQPLRPGAAHEMPGENVSFKRIVLENARQQGADFARDGFWKTFFCQGLEASGHSLIHDPTIVVYYHRQLSVRQVTQRRLWHGRCFGGMRARHLMLSRRAILSIGGIILPILLTARLFRRIWPKGRHRAEFLGSLPFALLAIICWSVGEWWGNLFGIGKSCEHI